MKPSPPDPAGQEGDRSHTSAPLPGATATSGEHFYPARAFADLARLESGSFWFQSRNRIILSTLRRFVGTEPARYLEIGCGTGFVLEGVSRAFPSWEVHGFDIHPEAVECSHRRAPQAKVRQANIHELPSGISFDAVGVFDVLEHLDDDLAAMRGIHRVLKPGGHLILTVPQHPSLWSPYDEAALHRRRYRRQEAGQRLQDAGFTVLFLSSFVSTLWPVLWWRRRGLRRLDPATAAATTQADLTPGHWLNHVGRTAMLPDELAARLGWPLPFGGSLLAVARKE